MKVTEDGYIIHDLCALCLKDERDIDSDPVPENRQPNGNDGEWWCIWCDQIIEPGT